MIIILGDRGAFRMASSEHLSAAHRRRRVDAASLVHAVCQSRDYKTLFSRTQEAVALSLGGVSSVETRILVVRAPTPKAMRKGKI